jgi:CheY-like chemotaxis protein
MFKVQKPVILLIEDDENDVVMIRHSLKKARVTLSLQVVRDGREALAYLSGEGRYASPEFPIPALVLLDLNLPKMDGFEVLRCARQQPHLDSIPVVVLTSSLDPRDADRAYALGANSFLSKPADFRDTVRLMLVLISQWLPAGSHRRDTRLSLAA